MFMDAESTIYGISCQPLPVDDFCYPTTMQKIDSKITLWDNVLRLMTERYGKENLTKLAAEARVGPGTVTRIKDQKTSIGSDVIDRIAVALGVQAWQLLAPKGGGTIIVAPGPQFSPEAKVLAGWLDMLPEDQRLSALNDLGNTIAPWLQGIRPMPSQSASVPAKKPAAKHHV